MKVLVLGLCRTGTTSIKEALKELGYTDVYDTQDVWNLDHAGIWNQAIDAKYRQGKQIDFSQKPFDTALQGYEGIADIPAALFAEDLIRSFPAAKAILTTRDVDGWCASMVQTVVHPVNFSLYFRACGWIDWHFARFDSFCQRYNTVLWKDDFAKYGRETFRCHNDAVRALLPSNELLEFQAVQGWEPLCQFLGQPIPSTPYPRTHSAREFREGDDADLRARYVSFFRKVALLALPVGVAGWAYWIRRRT